MSLFLMILLREMMVGGNGKQLKSSMVLWYSIDSKTKPCTDASITGLGFCDHPLSNDSLKCAIRMFRLVKSINMC